MLTQGDKEINSNCSTLREQEALSGNMIQSASQLSTLSRGVLQAEKSGEMGDGDFIRLEAERAEFERAKERLTLKHKNTSRWARRALKRGVNLHDDGEHHTHPGRRAPHAPVCVGCILALESRCE